MNNKFSVVMATYVGDHPPHVYLAAQSIFHQRRQPAELIIVVDGQVSVAHEKIFEDISELGNVCFIRNNVNVGPGQARHHGIMASSYDIVAIMDADDICLPERFEKQLAVLTKDGADIVGGWIVEFDDSSDDSTGTIRSVPETHEDILRLAKWRSPMNNVTIMFKKKAYVKAGGFANMRCFEDYDLFYRMLAQGTRFHNIPQVLVKVRSGLDMYKRRGGWQQIPVEAALLGRMRKAGFISCSEYLTNLFVRTAMRILPNSIRRLAYLIFLRRRKI